MMEQLEHATWEVTVYTYGGDWRWKAKTLIGSLTIRRESPSYGGSMTAFGARHAARSYLKNEFKKPKPRKRYQFEVKT